MQTATLLCKINKNLFYFLSFLNKKNCLIKIFSLKNFINYFNISILHKQKR